MKAQHFDVHQSITNTIVAAIERGAGEFRLPWHRSAGNAMCPVNVSSGISAEPRVDHAQYLEHWLRLMKGDKRAIFTAASKASEAVAYLTALQGG